MKHLSIRRIRTLILLLFISIVLILTFSALSNKDSVGNDASIADTFGNSKDLKNELDLNNDNEAAEDDLNNVEDDFTKEMNKDANDDIDNVVDNNTNMDSVGKEEKENFEDNDNNFDDINLNDEEKDSNNKDDDDNNTKDNSLEDEKDANVDNNIDDDNNIDNDNNIDDDNNIDIDDDKNGDNNIDTDDDKNGDNNIDIGDDKNGDNNEEDANGIDENNAEVAIIDDKDTDKTLIETNNNQNDDDKKEGSDSNKDDDKKKNDDSSDDSSDDEKGKKKGKGKGKGKDKGKDKDKEKSKEKDKGKDKDKEEEEEEEEEKNEPKKKVGVEFKLYHRGTNYVDGDDPEGKDCPVAWKWVSSQSESDIIALNVLDNLADINRVENFSYDKSRQKLLLMSMESTSNYKAMITKKNYFDYTIDYRLDSDVPIPYTYDFFNFSKPALPIKEKGKNGRGLAAVFISNCGATNKRLEFLNELMEHTKIDSFGMCSHNKDPYEEDADQSSWNTKMNTIRKYKFTLAFENSNDRDYVTEKFFQPLEAGSVPVFYGTSNIADFAPPHSYINAMDFGNAKELAEYLEYLDKNDKEYEGYLEWKKKAATGDFGENLNHLVEIRKYNSICQLLQRIKNMWINPYLTKWDRKDVPKNERACRLC